MDIKIDENQFNKNEIEIPKEFYISRNILIAGVLKILIISSDGIFSYKKKEEPTTDHIHPESYYSFVNSDVATYPTGSSITGTTTTTTTTPPQFETDD